MSYQALARKWRPQDFSSIIGQESIVTSLRHAIVDKKIAAAYLFSGIRGVGKTTAARVMAKALNCEQGPSDDPCNECSACQQISIGADLDVLEIDAATYSKVEQVRELTESLKYGPSLRPFKVVVLDEIHRLSRQAFDALLKIVEEPPPGLVFIFATTEKEAVPVTILSRCQEFNFRRVDANTLVDHLNSLCQLESISATDRALRLIARAAEGSVRDAVALMDQLATFGEGQITEEDAHGLIGGIHPSFFYSLLSALFRGQTADIRSAIHQIESEGWDPRRIHGRFLDYCRSALHLLLDPKTEPDLPLEDARLLVELSAKIGYEDLLRLLSHLLSSESSVRHSEMAILALELALLRAAELPKLIQLENLIAEGGGKGLPGPVPKKISTVPSPQAPPPKKTDSPLKSSRPSQEAALDSPEPKVPAKPFGPTQAIKVFKNAISQRRPILFAQLEDAVLSVEGNTLVIVPPPGDDFLSAALEREKNQDVVAAALSELATITKIDVRLAPKDLSLQRQRGESATPDHRPSSEVQAVLDIFDGQIISSKP